MFLLSLLLALMGVAALLSGFFWWMSLLFGFAGLAIGIFHVREKKTTGRWAIAVNGLVLITFAVLFVLFQVRTYRASVAYVAYYLPQDFSGWVKISYDVPGAKPLLEFQEGGLGKTIRIDIPPCGVVETSSSLYEDWHQSRYYRGETSFQAEFEGQMWVGAGGVMTREEQGRKEVIEHFYVFETPQPLSGNPSLPEEVSIEEQKQRCF